MATTEQKFLDYPGLEYYHQQNIATMDEKDVSVLDNSKSYTDSSVQAKGNELGTRIDNLILNAGDSSAECADARVTKDGTVHDTLKNRLDTEYSQLSSEIEEETNRAKNVENELAENATQLRVEVDTLNNGGLNLKEDFIGQQVNEWLDEHPEATTTVQDGSLLEEKIHPDFLPYIKNNYVTPQMFGAMGNANFYNPSDGKYYVDKEFTQLSNDDTHAFEKAIEYCGQYISESNPAEYYLSVKNPTIKIPCGNYLITRPLETDKPISFIGLDYHRSVIVFKASNNSTFLTIKRNGLAIGRNFGGMLYGFEIANLMIKSDRANQNNGINLQLVDGVRVHDLYFNGLRGYSLKIGTRQSVYDNINTLYCGDLENNIPDILLGYDDTIAGQEGERPNENKFVNSFFIYSCSSLVGTYGSGAYMETFDNCMFHQIENTKNGQIIFNNMFPNDSIGNPAYTDERYSIIPQLNILNSADIHFENCTHRIGGNKILYCDNASARISNSKYVGNFKRWDKTDEMEKNYIAYAVNNSFIELVNVKAIDAYKLCYQDTTSTVVLENVNVGSLQNWEVPTNYKISVFNKLVQFFQTIAVNTISGLDGKAININAYSNALNSVRNLCINMRNSDNTNGARFYFAGNGSNRWYMKFLTGAWLHLNNKQSGTINTNSETTIRVYFDELPSADYKVFLMPSFATSFFVKNKTTTTFDIQLNTIEENGKIDYLIIPTDN